MNDDTVSGQSMAHGGEQLVKGSRAGGEKGGEEDK